MFQRALQGYEKTLGFGQPDTMTVVQNWGCVSSQNKLTETEGLYQRALQTCEKILGPEQGTTVSVIRSLGLVYQAQDKPTEAEVLYQRALKTLDALAGVKKQASKGKVDFGYRRKIGRPI